MEKSVESPLLTDRKVMEEGYHSINTVRKDIEPNGVPNEGDSTRKAMLLSRCCALLCVGLAVVDWVVLAEIIQKLQEPDEHGESYSKPMFLCFCIRTTYMISFIPYVVWKYTPLGGQGRHDQEPFSKGYMFTRACVLNVLGYISGYTWYMSLPITSVSANTAIYMCACAAVFIISIPVLREKITIIKVMSLLICCTGILLVSIFSAPHAADIKPTTTFTDNLLDVHSPDTNKGSVLGYVLVLISMFMYASYEVFYGYLLQTDQDKHPAMTSLQLVGYLGVTTPVIFGLALPIWHFTGWETLMLPPADKVYLFFICLVVDAIFNILLLLAIALSNPTLASVGQSLALPASMVADLLLHHFLMPWPALIGAGCVFCGFCGFVYEELRHGNSHSSNPEVTTEDRRALLNGEESPEPYAESSLDSDNLNNVVA
ncbi:uncharacterized protein LOC134826024 isoform X2 [Bolinopsis microptera]|uniref:uncharacterized protein LOC134826024 isoform X2 n=1 Tax=Bolinopsis microptera TaxID=2820187 RepID=UPI003079B69D